jgi:uncharacterized protein
VSIPTTRLHVRVAPGATRSSVVGRHGAGWKVRVAAPPERGRANDAVIDLLASALAVPRVHVTLQSGGTSRDKTFVVHGVDAQEIEARLVSVAGDSA